MIFKKKNATQNKVTWYETIKLLWHYLANDKKRLIGAFILAFFKSIFSISLSIFIGFLIQECFIGFASGNTEQINASWSKLLYGCLIIFSGYVIYFCLYLLASKIVIKLSFNLGFKLRDLIFIKLHRMPFAVMQQTMTGDLMAKSTIDVNALAVNMSFSISNMFVAPIIVICVYTGLFILSPYLALIMVAMFVIIIIGASVFAKLSAPKFQQNQKIIGDMNVEVEEQISNRKVIKLFNLQEQAYDQFFKINNMQKNASIEAETKINLIYPWNEFVENLMLSILYVVAIIFFLNNIGSGVFGSISVAILTSFSMLARYANGEAVWSLRLIGNVQKMLISGERCLSILNFPNYVDESNDLLIDVKGDIKFENVCFAYKENQPVLKNISFFIPNKTTTTIVGPTGSGKTTIVNLLSRFYEINSGLITIDNIDIRKVSQKSLCDNVSVVLQDSFLFSETIHNNIAYGNLNASKEEIIAAAKAANIHNFIENLPNKYETIISEKTNDFSDGQIQMIALARAFLSKAPILILDEATSSVDTKTESDIQDAMLKLMKMKTVIVIAHRLSTIIHADQILVMNSGEIVEHGTHEELLNKKGFYYQLFKANTIMN
ncbi:ABC transporter ATP-binding protein [Mycoplasmoides pirum]|uniref:ABC transporter ATP-binding protein n=1 Tax=Mycoplasmoides pirum TaxID=2122 RepID=UPI0006968154|nr:ABC transporter ATP-binding protein [Mycoplasmoides pirum]